MNILISLTNIFACICVCITNADAAKDISAPPIKPVVVNTALGNNQSVNNNPANSNTGTNSVNKSSTKLLKIVILLIITFSAAISAANAASVTGKSNIDFEAVEACSKDKGYRDSCWCIKDDYSMPDYKCWNNIMLRDDNYNITRQNNLLNNANITFTRNSESCKQKYEFSDGSEYIFLCKPLDLLNDQWSTLDRSGNYSSYTKNENGKAKQYNLCDFVEKEGMEKANIAYFMNNRYVNVKKNDQSCDTTSISGPVKSEYLREKYNFPQSLKSEIREAVDTSLSTTESPHIVFTAGQKILNFFKHLYTIIPTSILVFIIAVCLVGLCIKQCCCS